MIKVLYIEDNEDDVYMLKMRLELLGDFKVLVAQNGEKGCEMAVSERPHVIIMDLEMPILDGWEATRWLKSNPQTRDIPVIALSAHALAGEREKAFAAGCDEFSDPWRASFGSLSRFFDLRSFDLIRRRSLRQFAGECLILCRLAFLGGLSVNSAGSRFLCAHQHVLMLECPLLAAPQ